VKIDQAIGDKRIWSQNTDGVPSVRSFFDTSGMRGFRNGKVVRRGAEWSASFGVLDEPHYGWSC